MGVGLESAIAGLSTNLSTANAQDLISIKMLDNLLDAEVQAASTMIADLKGMPSAGAGDLGGLMDVMV